MKKIVAFLRHIGLLHASTGDYYRGEFDSKDEVQAEGAIEDKRSTVPASGAPGGAGGASRTGRVSTYVLGGILFVCTIFFALAGFAGGVGYFFLMLVVWGVLLVVFWKGKLSVMATMIGAGVLCVVSMVVVPTEPTDTDRASGTADTEQAMNNGGTVPLVGNVESSGVIYIEGESGILSEEGAYTYLGESARGGEAYLGNGGISALYRTDIPAAGTYVLSVRVSDDGVHADGTRDAAITVDGEKLSYTHVSRDTGGWQWQEVGSVTLQQGIANIAITKEASTPAAFVMDAFKFTPQ